MHVSSDFFPASVGTQFQFTRLGKVTHTLRCGDVGKGEILMEGFYRLGCREALKSKGVSSLSPFSKTLRVHFDQKAIRLNYLPLLSWQVSMILHQLFCQLGMEKCKGGGKREG